jgi:tetratricopeptide (TPR) repeat protein
MNGDIDLHRINREVTAHSPSPAQGALDDAIADYTKAIKLSPTVTSYAKRAAIYGMRGALDRTIEDYSKAVETPGGFLSYPAEIYVKRAEGGLGLTDSLLSLIIAHTTFALPFALWLLRSFVAATPIELEEAARTGGAGRLGAFVDIVLPLARPGIISTALFAFILSWNEFRLTPPEGVFTLDRRERLNRMGAADG